MDRLTDHFAPAVLHATRHATSTDLTAKPAEVVCAKSCEDDCKSCGGLRYGLDGRWQKEDGDVDDRLDSDLLQMNVAFDTVTAGMVTGNVEDAYFEKVLVHDADDFMGRPFAQGDDEWSSWKAWVLMSIPKGEWDTMVNNMRSNHCRCWKWAP